MKKLKMPQRKWSSGRGALILIALLFAISALVRFGAGAGPAIAKEVAAFRSSSPVPSEPQACQNPEEIEQILSVLSAREEALDTRERQLEELSQSLEVAKRQVKLNLDDLTEAEEKLAATMAQSLTAAEDDLTRLTSVYENMKPKDASILFEAMAPEFAAGFVGRMRPDAAAQIMAGLSPGMAYSISVILAGRNTRAPTK